MKILIVEDNLIVSMMMEGELTDLGHEVVGPVISVEEAIASARDEELDLALVDFDLGAGGTGDEVVRFLNEKRRCPAIYITGNRERAIEAAGEAFGVVEKPLLTDDLSALMTAFDRFRAGEEPQWPHNFTLLSTAPETALRDPSSR